MCVIFSGGGGGGKVGCGGSIGCSGVVVVVVDRAIQQPTGWTRSQPADQPSVWAAGGRRQRQVKRDQDEKRDRNENSSSPEGGSYSGCGQQGQGGLPGQLS